MILWIIVAEGFEGHFLLVFEEFELQHSHQVHKHGHCPLLLDLGLSWQLKLWQEVVSFSKFPSWVVQDPFKSAWGRWKAILIKIGKILSKLHFDLVSVLLMAAFCLSPVKPRRRCLPTFLTHSRWHWHHHLYHWHHLWCHWHHHRCHWGHWEHCKALGTGATD